MRVLKYLAQSKTYPEIAKLTKYSISGVAYYIRNLLNKFNVDNKMSLVIKAVKAGVLDINEIGN